MKFFYSASTMGYGFGYKWHNKYNFPDFPRVTRTLTWDKKVGIPFAIIKYGDSVWNKVGLHNMGFGNWLVEYKPDSNVVVSLAGFDWQIRAMIRLFEEMRLNIGGVELNFSCPNVKSFNNIIIPETKYPLYLKLNHTQDPYEYDLTNIKSIRLNSVPKRLGGVSGRAAKKKNWAWINKYINEGLNVAGCSFTYMSDLFELDAMGCKEVGIGSAILTNPKLIESLSALG